MARTPLNELIMLRLGIFGIVFSAVRVIESCPALVVAVFVLSSSSSALGPTRMFPSAVGVTRTPFPFSSGHWNRVWCARFSHLLSRRKYSPRRALIEKFLAPAIRLILSAKRPDALITQRDSISVLPVLIVQFAPLVSGGVIA